MQLDRIRLELAKVIDGWTFPEELEWLMDTASRHKNIIEIGSWKGRSTKAIANKNSKLICIDTWLGSAENDGATKLIKKYGSEMMYNEFRTNLKNEINDGLIEIMKMSSDEAISLLQHLKGKVDMIFIDGNHHSPFIDNDIKNYLPLVKPGGIICGHDFSSSFPDVMKAVTELIPKYKKNICTLWSYIKEN